MNRHGIILLTALFLIIGHSASAEVAFVQKVMEGNTFLTLEGKEIKLLGVDIPELKPDISLKSTESLSENAQNAREFLKSLISGANVEIRFDTEIRKEDGAVLAYVWFLYPDDNYMEALEFSDDFEVSNIVDQREYGNIIFLNAAMIKAGYAVPDPDMDNDLYATLFNAIYHERNIKAVQTQDVTEVDLQAAVK